jgi:hypothetical protein
MNLLYVHVFKSPPIVYAAQSLNPKPENMGQHLETKKILQWMMSDEGK